MIADINNGFWIDIDDEVDPVYMFMLGYSKLADIMLTKTAIDCKLCNEMSTSKYTAIFIGCGLTFNEIENAENTGFKDVPPPHMYPIIGQDDDLDRLKSKVVKYIEYQFHAYRPGKKDWEKRIEAEEKILSSLIEKYYKIFSIKNYLN